MKSKRMSTLLALVAVFAVSGVVVASASATTRPIFEPEVGHGLPMQFSATEADPVFETSGRKTVSCEGVGITGELSKNGFSKIVETYHKCASGTLSCSNNGEGAIVTEPLKGTLGWLKSETSNEVGAQLANEANGSEPYMVFKCSLSTFRVTGHLIGEITNAHMGTYEHSYEFLYRQTAGSQDTFGFLEAPGQLYSNAGSAEAEEFGISANRQFAFENAVRIVSTSKNPARPVAETEAASSVGAVVATAKGSVNPEELLTKYHFEYGKTALYGSSTTAENVPGEGDSPVAVSTVIKGLEQNRLYHYRIVATNVDGTSYGEDKTFTTAAVTLPTFSVETGHSLAVKFASAAGAAPVIVSAKGYTIECKSVSGTGEIVEAGEGKLFSKTVHKVVVSYHECKATFGAGSSSCSNNSEKNAIVTESLKGTLGYLEPGVTKEVGLALEGEGEHGSEEPLYASFSCIEVGVKLPLLIRGYLISEVGPAGTYGTMRSTDTLAYKQSSGTQQLYKFPGVTNQLFVKFSSEPFEKLGIQEEPTLTFEGTDMRVEA
jgi:hypothetical protein